jgi:predicted alpha/beta-hydrolase family hydrolase
MRSGVDPCYPAHLGREGMPRAMHVQASSYPIPDHARVACRTAPVTNAIAVLCLAFPLQPPRRSRAAPAPSRLPELEAVAVPTLVVQGARDPFGMPPARSRRVVVEVPGDHSLKADLPAVAAAVQSWLSELLAGLR